MIVKMEKLSAVGLLEDRNAILSGLQRAQCIQMRPVETMEGYEEIAALTAGARVDVYTLEQTASRYATALSAITLYAKKRSMFTPKPTVLFEQLEDEAMLNRGEEICSAIEEITSQASKWRAERSKDAFTRSSLEPWADNDLPLELTGTRSVSVEYYLLPAKTDLAELEQLQQEQAPACVLKVVSQDKEQQYLLAICHNQDKGPLWEVLKSLGASRMSFGGLTGTARENISALECSIAKADQAIQQCESRLREVGEDIFPLQYSYDALTVKLQREKAGHVLRSTQKAFCFTAWVPESARQQALDILEQYHCYYELEQPVQEEGDEPPILLKNPKLVTPYEAVTNMYSPPSYWGFDANSFVAVTYFLFFGMMLGDAGFGLILFLGGLWLTKKTGMKGVAQVITMGGLSATVWGMVFGSFFGDTITVISDVFFGHRIPITPMLDPIGQAILVMGLCLVLGLIHLFMGMGIKAYMLIKAGRPWEALFNVGFWILFIVGLLLLLGGMFLGETMAAIGKWMSILFGVGIVLTTDRESKNPVMRILKGIAGLYDISGYLSDVLSYSRILALGLATGVIAQVFNIIGTLFGGGIIGFVFYIVVFSIGSALNLGINTLGSYVHTARLHYVEFFGKFYETGGKLYTPFAADTKYITVTK